MHYEGNSEFIIQLRVPVIYILLADCYHFFLGSFPLNQSDYTSVIYNFNVTEYLIETTSLIQILLWALKSNESRDEVK